MKIPNTLLVNLLALLLTALPAWCASAAPPPEPEPVPVDTAAMAAQVKAEFLHAWNNYKRYAWGHDELRPLSKTPFDWYGQSLLMTPVDHVHPEVDRAFVSQNIKIAVFRNR